MSETADSVSIETEVLHVKRQYTRGGKSTCAKCNEPHLPYHRYCADHKREYQSLWIAKRTQRLRYLEQITHTP